MSQPDWLPELAIVDGSREEVIANLYRMFTADFRQTGCSLREVPVRWDDRVLPGEMYPEGFWHLISREDDRTGVRRFDPPRAARLPWCKAVIENAEDSAVMSWRDRTRNRIRTYLWLREHDYAIVLEERRAKEFAFLVTTYYVRGESTRRRLRRSYARRLP